MKEEAARLVQALLCEAENQKAWIAVDLDGTLARYTGWKGSTHIGAPIPRMVRRVRRWISHGKKVKIFTARADDEKSVNAIKKWLKDNELPDLEITNLKDENMVALWDDRAVAVQKNTGKVKETLDFKPPYLNVDDDLELEIAARSAFTAHDLALRRGRHHPKLWAKVKGSPFEREYRRKFNPQEAKALLDEATIEQRLIDAAKRIKHCGDYGTLYYNPKLKSVHWTMGDADGPPNYTPSKEIAKLLKLPGIKHVEIGDEWSPQDKDWNRLI